MQENSREQRIKRLKYQSWYRGCKETDRIIGHFAKKYLDDFSDEEIDVFEKLLEETDRDIFNWLSGKAPVPSYYSNTSLYKKLAKFDISKSWS